jgi:MFS family permease
MSGLILLGLSTLLFACATTVSLLLAARVLQGLASSVPATIGITLLVEKVGSGHIGEALGWTTFGLTIGFFMGPILGGFLYQFAGYNCVFFPAYLLVVSELGLRALVIEGRISIVDINKPLQDEEHSTISTYQTDYGAIATFSSESSSTDMDSEPETIRKSASESTRLSCRGSAQSKTLRLLISPSMAVCMGIMMILSSFNGALEGVLPIFCKEILSFKSSQASLVFIPSSLPLLLSPWIGRLVDVSGAKKPTILAFLLGAITFIAMSTVSKWSSTDILTLAFSMFSFGIVSTIIMPAMMGEIAMVVEDMKMQDPETFGQNGGLSLGFGFNHCTISLGFLFGPVYGALVKETFGWSQLMLSMSGLCIFAIVLVTTALKTRIQRPDSGRL